MKQISSPTAIYLAIAAATSLVLAGGHLVDVYVLYPRGLITRLPELGDSAMLLIPIFSMATLVSASKHKRWKIEGPRYYAVVGDYKEIDMMDYLPADDPSPDG